MENRITESKPDITEFFPVVVWSRQFTLMRLLVAVAIFAIAMNCYSLGSVIQFDAYRSMPGPVRISLIAILLKTFASVLVASSIGCVFGGRRGFICLFVIGLLASPCTAFLFLLFHDHRQNVYS